MRRLELDFRRRPRASLGGWTLLAAGVLAAALAVSAGRQVTAATMRDQTALRQVEMKLPEAARPALSVAESKAREAALASMRRVQQQLNLPWDTLFETLESRSGPDIALLALTPDARKRSLRLSAEARDLEAMLAFHRQLEQSDALRDVSLLSHELVAQGSGRAIRFTLVANWVIDDAHP